MSEARLIWESCTDRTLSFTISLYIGHDELPATFQEFLSAENRDPARSGMPKASSSGKAPGAPAPREYLGTRDLQEAMDPLFNDIANRERNGRVLDFLLDVSGRPEGEELELHMPRSITWTTEGTTFEVDLEEPDVRMVRARRFWYVHLAYALSYHLSFSVPYEHSAADFYRLGLLQKAVAPKEFRYGGHGRASHVLARPTHILPLDSVCVREPVGGQTISLWAWVASRFDRDFSDLERRIRNSSASRPPATSPFELYIEKDAFLEIPGLMMPRARYMFFFQDREFFEALVPPSRPGEHGEPIRVRRMDRVTMDAFDRYPEFVTDCRDAAQSSGLARVKLPLAEIEKFAKEDLIYLFLAGFTQNIIDFINQDASEVLDSLDPIYPATAEQEEESFFIRFANPRALMTFVSRSRSLEAGNDWIGTCPYAFLIHALAMHNEFFVRAYERSATSLLREVIRADEKHDLRAATELFYAFRRRQVSDYQQKRYINVFRYDTEKDTFEALEARRGIARNVAAIEAMVDNVEKQTQDREARIAKRNDNRLAYLLGLIAIGTFGFDLVGNLKGLVDDHAIRLGGRWGIEILSGSGFDLAMLIIVSVVFGVFGYGIVLWFRKQI